RGPDGPEVLLIHRPRRQDWSLAKGKREPGEELPEPAIREVLEGASARGQPAGYTANDEVDEARWSPLARAYEQVSYTSDVGVLNDFARWPHRTVPFVVLRHASAGHKKDWDGEDLLRPLDFKGQSPARAPVRLPRCFG